MDGNNPEPPSPNLFVFDVERDLYARTPLYREAVAWWNANYAEDVYRRGFAGELRQLRRAGRRPPRRADGGPRRRWWEQNRRDWWFPRRAREAMAACSRDERPGAHLRVRDAARVLLITVLVTRPDIDSGRLGLREDTPWEFDATGRHGFGRSWVFEQWDHDDRSGMRALWMRLAAVAWELMRRQPDPEPPVAQTPTPPPPAAPLPSAAPLAPEPPVYDEDGARRHTPEQQALFRRVADTVRARPADFAAAGEWLDGFGEPGEAGEPPEAYPTVEAAARELWKNRPHYGVLADPAAADLARRVLLVAWVLSDPNDLSGARPAVTRVQDWAWGTSQWEWMYPAFKGDGVVDLNAPTVLNRLFARVMILDADLEWWVELVREALDVLARVAPEALTLTETAEPPAGVPTAAGKPPGSSTGAVATSPVPTIHTPAAAMLAPGQQVAVLGLTDGDSVRKLQNAGRVRKWAHRLGLPLEERKVGRDTHVPVDQFRVVAAIWKLIRRGAGSDNEAAKTLSRMRRIVICNTCHQTSFPKEGPAVCPCGSRDVEVREVPRRPPPPPGGRAAGAK